MLLFAWAPVATANAVACAAWCELNGGLDGHHVAVHAERDHGSADHSKCTWSISDADCNGPDLLVVSAVAPPAIAVPAVTSFTIAVAVATPSPFASISADSDTPPPRV